MSFSRFYRLEAHTAKSLIKTPTLAQRSCFSVIHNQNLRPQRCELFSSTATKVDSKGGSNENENEKINVTFVDEDGEGMHIKVPVGLSMLEASHENDIDLEEHVKDH